LANFDFPLRTYLFIFNTTATAVKTKTKQKFDFHYLQPWKFLMIAEFIVVVVMFELFELPKKLRALLPQQATILDSKSFFLSGLTFS
jgi:hypothetical protein